jgi:predicted membrane channel-forming protein YqfA (hemolysin III family)
MLTACHNDARRSNTWTHLLGALYVIYMLCSIMGGLHPLHPMPWTEWLALLVFLLCAVACLGLR